MLDNKSNVFFVSGAKDREIQILSVLAWANFRKFREMLTQPQPEISRKERNHQQKENQIVFFLETRRDNSLFKTRIECRNGQNLIYSKKK